MAFFKSGVDPVVVGLIMGLLTYAYPAARSDLERASDLFRLFREQPTPELAREARDGVRLAISPNERLQQLYHPWTSYLIVPLFALANAGVVINAGLLSRAFTSPVTLGILIGYVVGKPLGTTGTAWLVTTLSRGRIRPPGRLGRRRWAPARSPGSASPWRCSSPRSPSTARCWPRRSSASCPPRSARPRSPGRCSGSPRLLPKRLKMRALLGTSDAHHRPGRPGSTRTATTSAGRMQAPVTMVEYGDFECPYCGQAEPIVRELLADFGDVRYVFRHLPLNDVHPHAQLAAEAAEAAARQEKFWEMHDVLMEPSGRAHRARPDPATRPIWASTPAGSPTTCASMWARPGWPRTWTRPTCPRCPARPRSSSTANGTTAPTTSARCPRRSAPPGRGPYIAT